MKLANKEIESVSKLEPFERYQYTVKKIADWERLFIAINDDNSFLLLKVESISVISIWPAKEYALATIDKIGEEKIKEFSLNEFYQMIPYIKQRNILINVFSVDQNTGFVVAINEFMEDLNSELEKYS
jgi:hypothetical protein